MIQCLVKQNAQGDLLQPGAAMGTGYNVERAPDIVSALMMQNGTEMAEDDGSPTVALIPRTLFCPRSVR